MNLVIVPQPVRSLVAAGAVTSLAMWPESFTQAWGSSFSVSRATDYAMETEEVPGTTASVTSPVTSASIVVPVTTTSTAHIIASTALAATASSSCSTVIATAATVSSVVPVNAPSTSVSTASAPKSTPRFSECTDPPESEKVFSSPSSRPLNILKPVCPVSAKMFRSRLLEKFRQVEYPNFTGEDVDNRAKAYVRQKLKHMLEAKEKGLSKGDLLTWTKEELLKISSVICEILSIRSEFLKNYTFAMMKNYWYNARNTVKET